MHNADTEPSGVFDTSVQQTLYLFTDLKTDGFATFPAVIKALQPLREAGYLSNITNGTTLNSGPVTVIGTGNTPLSLVQPVLNRDYFCKRRTNDSSLLLRLRYWRGGYCCKSMQRSQNSILHRVISLRLFLPLRRMTLRLFLGRWGGLSWVVAVLRFWGVRWLIHMVKESSFDIVSRFFPSFEIQAKTEPRGNQQFRLL